MLGVWLVGYTGLTRKRIYFHPNNLSHLATNSAIICSSLTNEWMYCRLNDFNHVATHSAFKYIIQTSEGTLSHITGFNTMLGVLACNYQ